MNTIDYSFGIDEAKDLVKYLKEYKIILDGKDIKIHKLISLTKYLESKLE